MSTQVGLTGGIAGSRHINGITSFPCPFLNVDFIVCPAFAGKDKKGCIEKNLETKYSSIPLQVVSKVATTTMVSSYLIVAFFHCGPIIMS